MALASLRFDAGKHVNETRQGYVIYGGAPSRLHEWEFRTKIKYDAVKDDDKKHKKAVSNIVDSLDGDAATIAMDIGVDALMAEDGIEKLIERLKAKAFLKLQTDAKECTVWATKKMECCRDSEEKAWSSTRRDGSDGGRSYRRWIAFTICLIQSLVS